jgi:tetratricopeptide (TPR) repeat protein
VLPLVVVTLVGLSLAAVGIGLHRYGGYDGLALRVRAEFGLEPTRDLFVPTPLPTPTARPTLDATATLAPTEPPATPTPPPTAAASATLVPASATLVPASATPSATPPPTATLASPSATPTAAIQPALPAVALTGQLRHEWQTWNNCGPATLSMYLSYYGAYLGQEAVRATIRPNWEDKHASAHDMAEYARAQGFNALVRYNGDADRLRLLLSNGVPVMVATWHIDSKGEQMGHYRLITGYDDARQEWIVWDSLEARGVSANKPYVGVRLPYEEMEHTWPVYSGIHLVIYDEAQAPTVRAIIGEDWDDATMWRRALAAAEALVEAAPENGFAWFSLGTALLRNDRAEEAAAAFDRARVIGLPYRMMWYQFGAFEAYYQVGRYEEVIALADATLKVTSDVEELHYWRALALEALGDLDGARAALRTALEKKANYEAARVALARLGE